MQTNRKSSTIPERYRDRINGVLHCFDRLVFTGTLPGLCYAEGMTAYLKARDIRIFDYAKFAEELRDTIRQSAEAIERESALSIEFINKPKSFRKEKRIKQIIDAGESTREWFTSIPQWSLARATRHGMTSRAGRPF